jgi:hypothetical protein
LEGQCSYLIVGRLVEDGAGPVHDDLAGQLLVGADLLGVLVQVHHRLPNTGLLQPRLIVNTQGEQQFQKLL